MADKQPIELESSASARPQPEAESRRNFLRKFGSGIFAGVVAAALQEGDALLAAPKAEVASPAVAPLEVEGGENSITRMLRELHRALEKPVDQRKWVMVIDLGKCVGCHACNIACIAENHLPPGVVYRPVLEEEIGAYPNVTMRFTPRPCMQCENPPCVDVCPVNATWRSADGIIDVDYEQCIGCRYCMAACPYYARTFDFGYHYTDDTPELQLYEQVGSFEYGRRWDREGGQSPVGNVRKCHFCRHKLDAGMLPSCVTTCIGMATFFGDASDPDSLVAELIARPNVMRLKEEAGTNPRVYYLL